MQQRLIRFVVFNPAFAVFLLTALLMALSGPRPRPVDRFHPERIVEVEGWICQPPLWVEDSLQFELSPLSLDGLPSPEPMARFRVTVNFSSETSGLLYQEPLKYGDIICFRAFLEVPGHYAIFGVEDFRETAWRQGISHYVRLKSPLLLQRKGSYDPARLTALLFSVLYRFEADLAERLNPASRRLIQSVFLGRKSALETVERNRIRRLGIFHLFVVSGFHVSVVVMAVHVLAGRFGWPGRVVTLGALWSYVLLVGSAAPALRAGVMTSIAYLLLAAGLSRLLLNGLGMAGLLLLFLHPEWLFQPGFQLSFLCLAAIGLLVVPSMLWMRPWTQGIADVYRSDSPLLDALPRRRRVRYRIEAWLPAVSTPVRVAAALLSRFLEAALGLLLCSAWIQLFLLPVSLYYGNQWNWTQIPVNVLLMPLFSIFIPLCLFYFLTFPTPLVSLSAWLVGHSARGLDRLMEGLDALAEVSYGAHPGGLELGIYLILFPVLFSLRRGRRRWLLASLPVCLWLSFQMTRPSGNQRLEITLLDVGQGEAIHLRYPDGSESLVDCGGLASDTTDFVGRRLVSRYLWHLRSRGLAYVLLTHPHADHVQGFDFVRQAFRIDRLFYTGNDGDDAFPGEVVTAGQWFDIGPVRHTVLHPPPDPLLKDNDVSIVHRLDYGDFSMLFTGDIGQAVEQELAGVLGPATVLKVAHHGSRSSSSEDFLKTVRPALSLISAGRNNSFGHPSREVIERFDRLEIPVFSTAVWGSLKIVTDGYDWTLFAYSARQARFHSLLASSRLNSGTPELSRMRRSK